jgi:hypothetical protein
MTITPGGIWMAQQSGFAKMRRFLSVLGVDSVEKIL